MTAVNAESPLAAPTDATAAIPEKEARAEGVHKHYRRRERLKAILVHRLSEQFTFEGRGGGAGVTAGSPPEPR